MDDYFGPLLTLITDQARAERDAAHHNISTRDVKRGLATCVTKLEEAKMWMDYAQAAANHDVARGMPR